MTRATRERTAVDAPGPTLLAVAYVVAVAVLATWGFASGSTVLILVAFALALPTGAPALVGYYLAYGLLAQVPGATPSSGEQATWFAVTAAVLGALAPTVAALANVLLLRLLLRRRRVVPVDDDSRLASPAS
jgi:hypothetical protein